MDTNNDLFFVLNAQGNILKTVHTSDRMFLEKDNVLYMEKFPSIAATDINSKNELWQVELGHLIDHAPIFDEGTIFLDTQSNPNTIYSVDQVSGKVNWKVNQSVLSNMYVSGDRIYFINDLDRFTELTYGQKHPDLNSHGHRLEKYRVMLAIWKSFDDRHNLNPDQIRAILDT